MFPLSQSTAAARAETCGAFFGISGAVLLALAVPVSKWGWVLFLASNCAWLLFAMVYGYKKLVAQTGVFTLTSLLGIANSFFPGNPIQSAIRALLS